MWLYQFKQVALQEEIIKKLEKKGFTYKTSDGIYFDSTKFKNYGKLAKLNIKKLKLENFDSFEQFKRQHQKNRT